MKPLSKYTLALGLFTCKSSDSSRHDMISPSLLSYRVRNKMKRTVIAPVYSRRPHLLLTHQSSRPHTLLLSL